MAGKQNIGVRNKVIQIILIDSHPDYIYENKTHISHTVIIKDKVFNLGKINTDFINIIKDIPGIEVTSEKIVSKRVKGIEDFKRLNLRNYPDSTTIEVSAKTERDLAYKINDLRLNLLENGIDSVERCTWICVIDVIKDKNEISKNEIIKNEILKNDSLLFITNDSLLFITNNNEIDDNEESKKVDDNEESMINEKKIKKLRKERKIKELREMVNKRIKKNDKQS